VGILAKVVKYWVCVRCGWKHKAEGKMPAKCPKCGFVLSVVDLVEEA